MGADQEPTMSVVIVARNEADRIRGCIESVLALCEPLAHTEVILVDSNSSDPTVDVATEYPITILKIPTDDLSSPSAGRQVGFRHARGELVLFVDGDTHLTDGWLDDAIRFVSEHEDVAGVDGHLEQYPETDPGAVEWLRGVALYDADALDAVGGFDPWMTSHEELDVGYRLGRAGYRFVRLPVAFGTHPTSIGYGELRRRWRSGFFFGYGQALRKSLDDPAMAAKWAFEFTRTVAPGSWVAIGGLLALARRGRLGRAWFVSSLVAFVYVASTRGLRWTVYKPLSDLGYLLGGVIGFARYDPGREFPYDRVERLTPTGPTDV